MGRTVRGMDDCRGRTASSAALNVNDLLFLLPRKVLAIVKVNCVGVITL